MPLIRAIACLASERTAPVIAITPRKRPSQATNNHVNATDLLLECTLHRFDLTRECGACAQRSFISSRMVWHTKISAKVLIT
jgi:hypothetical protein